MRLADDAASGGSGWSVAIDAGEAACRPAQQWAKLVIDERATRHDGYAISQRLRKRIEEAFGWIKTVAGQEKTKLRDLDRVGFAFTLAAAAYNLVRLPKLLAQGG